MCRCPVITGEQAARDAAWPRHRAAILALATRSVDAIADFLDDKRFFWAASRPAWTPPCLLSCARCCAHTSMDIETQPPAAHSASSHGYGTAGPPGVETAW